MGHASLFHQVHLLEYIGSIILGRHPVLAESILEELNVCDDWSSLSIIISPYSILVISLRIPSNIPIFFGIVIGCVCILRFVSGSNWWLLSLWSLVCILARLVCYIEHCDLFSLFRESFFDSSDLSDCLGLPTHQSLKRFSLSIVLEYLEVFMSAWILDIFILP